MTNIPSYTITLDPVTFIKEYNCFRKATSGEYSYTTKTYDNKEKKISYRAVDKSSSDYAFLNIAIPNGVTLTLIVNLEFYYVYGFLIDDKVFAYGPPQKDIPKKDGKEPQESEAVRGLRQAGFEIAEENILPFGDAYFQIANEDQRLNVANTRVTIEDILTSIETIVDLSIPWDDKREDLLCVFWSLIEGIRFNGISHTIYDLLVGNTQEVSYSYFYYMAERWAELSIGAAFSGKVDKSIAVYELHRLQIPPKK